MNDVLHTQTEGDARAHVTDQGELCPCMPRCVFMNGSGDEPPELVLVKHNRYDGRETGEVCRRALYLLGLALTSHDHNWTPEERDAFEHADHVLAMHWPETLTEALIP